MGKYWAVTGLLLGVFLSAFAFGAGSSVALAQSGTGAIDMSVYLDEQTKENDPIVVWSLTCDKGLSRNFSSQARQIDVPTVPAGDIRLTISVTDKHRRSVTLSANCCLKDGECLRGTVHLDGSFTSRIVAEEGKALPDVKGVFRGVADIRLGDAQLNFSITGNSFSQDNGQFSILYMPRGQFSLRVDPAKLGERFLLSERDSYEIELSKTVTASLPSILLRRGNHSISGKVVLADGKPAAGMKICAVWCREFLSTGEIASSSTVGPDGQFLIGDLPVSRYVLEPKGLPDSYVQVGRELEFDLMPQSEMLKIADPIVFEKAPFGVKVIFDWETDSIPADGLLGVMLMRVDSKTNGDYTYLRRVSSCSDKEAVFSNLPSGKYLVTANVCVHPSPVALVELEDSKSPISTVSLKLPRKEEFASIEVNVDASRCSLGDRFVFRFVREDKSFPKELALKAQSLYNFQLGTFSLTVPRDNPTSVLSLVQPGSYSVYFHGVVEKLDGEGWIETQVSSGEEPPLERIILEPSDSAKKISIQIPDLKGK